MVWQSEGHLDRDEPTSPTLWEGKSWLGGVSRLQ